MRNWRIAVVVQRYGEEVNGGAELHARWLAERLQSLGEVEVITTCATEYTTWENVYAPGESCLNGVRIHRFPVDAPRDWKEFQKTAGLLVTRDHSILDEMEWMKQQGPFSTPLFNFIQANYQRYDAFIFFTYLYATTYYGLPLVSDKAILVPTAHEEPYLYLSIYRALFHLPRVIVYNTESERRLVNQVTHNTARPQVVVGVGINVPEKPSAQRFRDKHQIREPFLLYVGRVDPAKNVPELLDYFARFRQDYKEPLKLVLIGNAYIDLPRHPDIVHLGFLPEEDKFDALQAATAVMIPSLYESLSMIALEAWLMQTPVLVNGRCDVLKQQCRQSNGGLYYLSYEEFERGLTRLLDSPQLQRQLGRQGQQFAAQNYHWDIVIAKYQVILEETIGHAP